METSLRLVLLVLGCVIVAGIIWDSRRSGLFRKKMKSVMRQENFEDIEDIQESEENREHIQNEPRATIIALHLMARRPHLFLGKQVVEALSEVHIFYGEMQIFHRFSNIDGTGEPIFSVVSAVEPGFFEISKMETFTTPGLTLFFAATSSNQAISAFELMLRTAKQLALQLDGELKDDHHRPLTPQIIEKYRERIRVQPSVLRAIRV